MSSYFSEWLHGFQSHQQHMRVIVSLLPCQYICFLFEYRILVYIEMLLWFLFVFSWWLRKLTIFLMCFSVTCISCLQKYLFKLFIFELFIF